MAKSERQRQIEKELLSQEKAMIDLLGKGALGNRENREKIKHMIGVHLIRRLYLNPEAGKTFSQPAREVLSALEKLDQVDLMELEKRANVESKKIVVMESKLTELSSLVRKQSLIIAAFENASKAGIQNIEQPNSNQPN